MTTTPVLNEAFEEEAKGLDFEELMMSMMASVNEEKGYIPTPVDEIRIRKMMLARKYIEKEAARLTMLRDAIADEWTVKINKKKQEIQSINEFIEMWLKTANKGQKLSLDVGTASLRRSAPKVVIEKEDVDKAIAFLTEHNELSKYLKPAPLDTTLLQNTYMNHFKSLVEAEAQIRIERETEAAANKKITKKREGEILLEVEKEFADDYYSQLPDFFKYEPEDFSLSIKMK